MIRAGVEHVGLRTALTVDGQLAAESMTAVEACCREVESERKQLPVLARGYSRKRGWSSSLAPARAHKGVRLYGSGVYMALVQSIGSKGGHT